MAYDWYTNPGAAQAAQDAANQQYRTAFNARNLALSRQAAATTPRAVSPAAVTSAASTTGSTGAAIPGTGPIASAGGIPYGDLANSLNTFMAGQAKNQFVQNMPDYQNLVNKFSANTSQQLAGQLPRDVITQLQQGAAERGIATGSPGSPNSNAAYLRSLGLNSLQMQQQGAQNLHQGIADTPISPTWNPASLFVPEMLANQELSAARSGIGAGAAGGNRGGGYITGMPNIGVNTGPDTPPSWMQSGGTSAGGTGPFYNTPSQPYQPIWGDTYGGGPDTTSVSTPADLYSDWWDQGPAGSINDWWDNGAQTYSTQNYSDEPLNYIPGQGGVTDWSQYGNIDWSMYE